MKKGDRLNERKLLARFPYYVGNILVQFMLPAKLFSVFSVGLTT